MEARRGLKLSIPPRRSEALDFCDGSAAAVRSWAEALPVSNPLKTARALHDALDEANHCALPIATRFGMLEVLRPYVRASCTAVTHRRRDTPVLVDPRARKEAALAQRVQYQLALGYKIVIVEGLRAKVPLAPEARDARGTDPHRVLTSVHRALTELAQTLLRSLQFYTAPPKRLWEELHTLYSVAEARGVLEVEILDTELTLRERCDISDVYERTILLASAQPNTLRQSDLGTLFTALEDWCRRVRVTKPSDAFDPVVVVDLDGGGPPVSAGRAPSGSAALRVLDTRALTSAFETWLEPGASSGSDLAMLGPDTIDLVRHCMRAWGETSDRTHPRTPRSGDVDACAGLPHVHFHAGGARSLLQQMQSDRIEEEQDDTYVDPFAGASDSGGGARLDDDAPKRFISTSTQDTADDHPLAQLSLADASPVGFGLRCEGAVPEGLQTGVLLGLREPDDPDWRITLVRWVANSTDRSRIGVETLALRAMSGGARVVSSRGREVEFVRALLLPGSEALEQPTRLLAAPGSFAEGQKIAFTQHGHETKLLIEGRLPGADSFDQFEVRELASTISAQSDTGIEFEEISEEEELAALEAFGLNRD